MSEKKGKYEVEDNTENALEMLGKGYNQDDISTEFTSILSGFTPAPDVLTKNYGFVTSLTWGRVWRFSQMADGVCRASIEKIAESLGMSERTIIRHLDILCEDGYLKDTTPDLRNKPHIYADTGKIKIRVSVEAGMTLSHPAMTKSQRHYDRESVEESIKKPIKKKDIYTPEFFRNLTVPEAYKVPTIKLYREATGFMVGSAVWEYVHNFITENSLTHEQIKTAFVAWKIRGFKSENVQGILEWARDGVPNLQNGKKQGQKPAKTNLVDNSVTQEWLALKQEKNGVL